MQGVDGSKLEASDTSKQVHLDDLTDELRRDSLEWFDGADDRAEKIIEHTKEVVCLSRGINESDLHPETDRVIGTALSIVRQLQGEISKRVYDRRIKAVHVLSGAGSYFEENNGEDECRRWTDRDKIKAGVCLVRAIAGDVCLGKPKQSTPILFYNGAPNENPGLHQNDVMRKLRDEGKLGISAKNVVISDGYHDEVGYLRDVEHTAHQMMDLYQRLTTSGTALHKERNVLVVDDLFLRAPFYMQKYLGDLEGGRFWAMQTKRRRGSPKRKDTAPDAMLGELTRLVWYLKEDQLSDTPIKLENVQI